MVITLKFANGNFVDVHAKQSTGLFTVLLNNKARKTKVTADELIIILAQLRTFTCVVTNWKEFLD